MYIIEIPYLNLNQIYNSGQIYNWYRVTDYKYIIAFKSKSVVVEQKKQKFIFDCIEKDFFDIWWDYFDCKTDYMVVSQKLKSLGCDFASVINRGDGIHILNQDFFETVVTAFIMSNLKNNREYEKRQCLYSVRALGYKHCKPMRELGKVNWYEFPTPEKLLQEVKKITSPFDERSFYGLKDKITELAECFADGWLDPEIIVSMDDKDALSYLMDFMDEKAAKEVMLFSMHRLAVFPDDKVFCDVSKDTGLSINDLYDWCFDDPWTKEHAGYLYLRLVHHHIHKPKDLANDKIKKKRGGFNGFVK